MKKVITFLLIMVGVAGVLWVAKGWTPRRNDPKAAKFNSDAENLILGIQQYREFTGSYPTGPNVAIAKALLGQTEKKVLILAVRRADQWHCAAWRTGHSYGDSEREPAQPADGRLHRQNHIDGDGRGEQDANNPGFVCRQLPAADGDRHLAANRKSGRTGDNDHTVRHKIWRRHGG